MKRIFSGILFVCILLVSYGCRPSAEAEPLLEMICLDVGQGSATLLRTPQGDILVDAGTEAGQRDLCLRLDALGVEKLSLLILTHPDEDHIGGADGILEQFETERVWVNGRVAENDSYRRFSDTLMELNVPVETVEASGGAVFGELYITVLSPLSDSGADPENDESLVLLLQCASFSALMMGDASDKVEMKLLESYGSAHLAADVLLVGHHGSNDSTCSEFLETVQPEYAVISCGAGNSYGHPDGRTLARLESVGAEILRTDLQGDLCFSVFEDEFFVSDKTVK